MKFVNNTRKDFTFLARSRPLICFAHFSEDCRERSSALKESLGLKSKYRLKPGSIPTLKAPNIESTRYSELGHIPHVVNKQDGGTPNV